MNYKKIFLLFIYKNKRFKFLKLIVNESKNIFNLILIKRNNNIKVNFNI